MSKLVPPVSTTMANIKNLTRMSVLGASNFLRVPIEQAAAQTPFSRTLLKGFPFNKDLYVRASNTQNDVDKKFVVQNMVDGFELQIDKYYKSKNIELSDEEKLAKTEYLLDKMDYLLDIGCALVDILEQPHVLLYKATSINERHTKLLHHHFPVHPLGITWAWANQHSAEFLSQQYEKMGENTSLIYFIAERLKLDHLDVVEHFTPLAPCVDVVALGDKIELLMEAGCDGDRLKTVIDELNQVTVDEVQEWLKTRDQYYGHDDRSESLLRVLPTDYAENFFKMPFEEINRLFPNSKQPSAKTMKKMLQIPFIKTTDPGEVLNVKNYLHRSVSKKIENSHGDLTKDRISKEVSLKEAVYQRFYKHLPVVKRWSRVYIGENDNLVVRKSIDSTFTGRYVKTDLLPTQLYQNFEYLKSEGFKPTDINACLFILDNDPTVLTNYIKVVPTRKELQPYEEWEKNPQALLNAIQYLIHKDKNFE